MRLIFTSYISSPEFDEPELWLKRIEGYTGILEALSKDHTVIGIERINYEGNYEKDGVQYFFTRQKQRISRFPFRMHRLIRKLKPDIVFVNGFIFPFQLMQLRLKLGKAVKIIVINHAERPGSGLRKFLQQQADRFVYRHFFTAKEMGTAWVKAGIIGNEQKIVEVMEASSLFSVMDKAEALARTGASGSPVFLWVGRLDANKDPLTVIKAFGKFVQQQPLAKLCMIYHTEELKGEIESLCEKDAVLKNAVVWVGKLPHDELQYWYNSAAFIIAASHYEGSGVAVCEAMSCSCVPLLTNIDSFRKMTGHGKCGFLYEPGNDEALFKILMQAITLNMEEEKAKVLQQFNAELSFTAIVKNINAAIS